MKALLLCSLLVRICNGQTCTSPIQNNSGVVIRGSCPSSQVIAPVGSIVQLECSYSNSSGHFSFWNITDLEPIVGVDSPHSISVTVSSSGGDGYTILTLPVTKQDSVYVQCGLCKKGTCFFDPLQPTVISLPVQLISFGK